MALTKKCLETIVASLNSYVIPGHDQESIQLNGSPIESRMTKEETQNKINAEIIVLDNASTDGSTQMLKTFQKNFNHESLIFNLIESPENLGFAKGNNRAVVEATGKYLLFLNSDTEALDDAIIRLYDFCVTEQKSYDFVGGKLLEKDGKTPQASAGPEFNLLVIFTFLFLRGDYLKITRYSPNKTQKVAWVSGACLMCHKDDFERLGGFDEKIFMYMEEIDLLYRVHQNKMTVGFYPKAHFIHHGSASSETGREGPIIKVFEGLLYFYKKHHDGTQFVMLKWMLIAKAAVALAIGRFIGNNYLIETYEKAYKLAKAA